MVCLLRGIVSVMGNKLALMTGGFLLTAAVTAIAAEPQIDSAKAPLYIGKSVMACGTVAEINHMPNRHYINFDKKNPNQSLTALVWNKDYVWFEKRYGRMDSYVGKKMCVLGNITSTQSYLQINVTNLQFLRLPNR